MNRESVKKTRRVKRLIFPRHVDIENPNELRPDFPVFAA